MTGTKRLVAGLGSMVLMAAFTMGQSSSSLGQNAQEAPADASAVPADPALAAAIEAGKNEYLKNCRKCHGSKGTAGVPLAKNPKVVGNPGYVIWATLTGPGYMPEFAPALSNEQIAAIATFVEHSWGDSSGIVTPDDVQAAR